MRKYHLMLIMLLFVLFACSEPQEGEVYFPKSAKGSQWDYLFRYQTPEGKILNGRMMVSIEGKETINGKKYYKQSSVISGIQGAAPQYSYSRRTKEGIWRIEGVTPNDREYLSTPFPLTVGKTWSVKSSDGVMNFVADRIETVKPLGKEYEDALKVYFSGDKGASHIEGYSYFAPHIGEIWTRIQIGNVGVEYILDKYSK